MAIKGLAYTKTSWNFQERPVASAKLNTWDDRMEAALELLCLLLHKAWGGGDGVIRTPDAAGLRIAALATPGLAVQAQPGLALISGYPYRLAAALTMAPVPVPVSFPRLDLIQANLSSWSVSRKEGIEAGSPVAPSVDADCIALARLYLRPSMTSIKNTDDSTNGYIIDYRSFL